MAHTLYTPTQAARSVLAALRWQSTLPRTVRQDFSADFVPGIGIVRQEQRVNGRLERALELLAAREGVPKKKKARRKTTRRSTTKSSR